MRGRRSPWLPVTRKVGVKSTVMSQSVSIAQVWSKISFIGLLKSLLGVNLIPELQEQLDQVFEARNVAERKRNQLAEQHKNLLTSASYGAADARCIERGEEPKFVPGRFIGLVNADIKRTAIIPFLTFSYLFD